MKQFEIKLEIGGNLNNSLLIILLDRWSCCLAVPDEDEKPRFDMPWHVAT
jgi:hypothetical protein